MSTTFRTDLLLRVVASIILLTACIRSSSQSIRIDHLSVMQGLSQGTVVDIFQDRYKFIWVATEDGLNVYDGYEFTIYRNNPEDSFSLSNNNVDCITEDA